VKLSSEKDRRQFKRFPQSVEVRLRPLPQLGARESKAKPIPGRLQNMSQGGICVITPSALKKTSLLRCEISLQDAPISLPTLMQVCWTRKQVVQTESYLSGLQFIL